MAMIETNDNVEKVYDCRKQILRSSFVFHFTEDTVLCLKHGGCGCGCLFLYIVIHLRANTCTYGRYH